LRLRRSWAETTSELLSLPLVDVVQSEHAARRMRERLILRASLRRRLVDRDAVMDKLVYTVTNSVQDHPPAANRTWTGSRATSAPAAHHRVSFF
jgi:hypothetical protein